MTHALSSERMLAIIDTQHEIAAGSLDLDDVMQRVAERAQALLGTAGAVVELLDGEQLVYAAASGAGEPFRGLRLQAASSLSGLCIAGRQARVSSDTARDPRVNREACRRVGVGSMVCVPLLHGARALGVLKVFDPAPHAFGESDVATLELLSHIIGAHIANANAYQEQLDASRRDALTGLPNRRDFDARLAAEAARARRHGGELTVCMIDLDGFKAVNDEHGHAAGDGVLRAVAGHLERLRGEDTAFRLGGDEFALLLVGADCAGATVVVSRIAAAVASDRDCMGTTVSWGLAALCDGDALAALEAADASLYEAKRSAHGAGASAPARVPGSGS